MKESIRDFLLPVHSPARELPAKKMNVFLIWIIFLYRERINKTNEEIVTCGFNLSTLLKNSIAKLSLKPFFN